MISRHPKRWCQECHMMVFSREHAVHGRTGEAVAPVQGAYLCADLRVAPTDVVGDFAKDSLGNLYVQSAAGRWVRVRP